MNEFLIKKLVSQPADTPLVRNTGKNLNYEIVVLITLFAHADYLLQLDSIEAQSRRKSNLSKLIHR